MVVCTSQFNTLKRYIQSRNLPFETLVYMKPDGKENPFTKDTYVNCNDIKEYPIDFIKSKYEEGTLNFSGVISDNYYQQILTGIHSSPLVEKEIKNQIPENNN